MTAPLKLEKTAVPRVHYENALHEKLAILWARKLLISAIVGVALVLQSIALVLLGPRYTGEAMIQLSFTREEPATGARSQAIAALDAAAVADSKVRLIRSRATASAVVTRLELDKDPSFTRLPLSWQVFSTVRSAFGLAQPVPSNQDLAINYLLEDMAVNNEPRSYLISISFTTPDPQRSAQLANTVAVEYLRGQLVQQLSESYAAIEREVGELASVYGVNHPSYLGGRAKLQRLQARLTALREGTSDEDLSKLVVGQSLIPADQAVIPSGPKILLMLGLAGGVALVAAAWLALLLSRRRSWRAQIIPAVLVTTADSRTGNVESSPSR